MPMKTQFCYSQRYGSYGSVSVMSNENQRQYFNRFVHIEYCHIDHRAFGHEIRFWLSLIVSNPFIKLLKHEKADLLRIVGKFQFSD